MTGMQGPQALELSVVNTLTTYLNGQIDDVWSRFSTVDASDSDAPAKVYPTAILAGKWDITPQVPVITVDWLNGVITDDASGPAGSGWNIIDHSLDITVTSRGIKKAQLDHYIKRMMTAIWKTIQEHQQLDGQLIGCTGAAVHDLGVSRQYTEDKQNILTQHGGVLLTISMEESL